MGDRALLGLLVGALGILPSCVERTLTIRSDPPGALVQLNGDEVGRTPMTRDFTWYSNYDVVLRKEGYETLKTSAKVYAPLWQWIPLDLIAELLPVRLRDHHTLSYNLQPASTRPADPQRLMDRAAEARGMLQSSSLEQR